MSRQSIIGRSNVRHAAMRRPLIGQAMIMAGALAAAVIAGAASAEPTEIAVQSRYPALQFPDAAPGGAHPIGGPSKAFVDRANAMLAPFELSFAFHNSGRVNGFDADNGVQPRIVDRREWGSLHKAVAAGPEGGGLTAAMGIPANSGLAFGEYYSGGVPFGLTADEFITFLLAGGGLELQQRFYDEAFEGDVKVLPIAVTGAQGSGFFPDPIPVATADVSAEEALASFCRTPLIVRYPGGAAAILEDACAAVGESVDRIGRTTRCEDASAVCGSENPDNKIAHEPARLTVGGFAPGVIPHTMYATGNIDAFELNMPTGHVQFLKLAAGAQGRSDAEADLSEIAPPYHYGTSWHQPWLYAELIFNRAAWDALPAQHRALIEMASRAALVEIYADRISRQGAAIDTLTRAGVTHLSWPPEMIAQLAASADQALDREAAKAAAEGDDTLSDMLAAMRAYAAANQVYFDFGDVTQGRSNTPSRP